MEQTNIAYLVVQTSFFWREASERERGEGMFVYTVSFTPTDTRIRTALDSLERALADMFLSVAHRKSDL